MNKPLTERFLVVVCEPGRWSAAAAAAGPSHLLLAPFITLPAMASVFTTT